MKRRRFGSSTSPPVYPRELLGAIGKFLPHRGLPLRSGDERVRWTDRLLVVMAMLMAWQEASSLRDAFETCWQVVTRLYPTRRRAGHSYEGFIKSLERHSGRLLPRVMAALRRAVRRVAGRYWKVEGWLVMGVDGSRIECPRTAANEAAFGCAGKDKTTPQQFVTAVLHVGTGLLWDWRRGGGKEAERTHLREMIAALPPKALLLADAGFTGYALLRELMAGGRSFIIRAGGNVRLLRKLGFAVREYDGIVYLWPQGHRQEAPLVLRLVVLHDGRKPVYLLTSVLGEAALSDGQVGAMYRRRWGLEVFYRSLKRTMEKHKLHSKSPGRAGVELDWALASLWLLGLLTVERMVRRGVSPTRWSVAASLRVVRRVMSGRGGRRAARGLSGLGQALKDSYVRRRAKTARDWPHKKTESPPRPPIIRTARRPEKLKAQRFKDKKVAA
jgi:hypothetical protein